jgi:hypothetical protein
MANFTDSIFADDFIELPPPDDTTAFRDLIPPVATLLDPAPSTGLQPNASVTLRVVDDRRVRRAFLWVEYADTTSEVIFHDGAFLPAFAALSSASSPDSSTIILTIARGVDVEGNRVGGWPSRPRIYIAGIDEGGNVS